MNKRPKFYMQRVQKTGVFIDPHPIDLESKFKGMYVLKVKGLNDYGDIKNITKEVYAEKSEPRLHFPEVPVHDTTDVLLTVGFLRQGRIDNYHAFIDFVSNTIVDYWDTERGRKVSLYLAKDVKVKEDELFGSCPNMIIDIPFVNIKGKSEKVK